MAIRWVEIPELNPRLAIGPAPGSYGSGGVFADLRTLGAAGFVTVICLLEADELADLREEPTLAMYRGQVERAGMTFVHVPVEDYKSPSQAQVTRVNSELEGGLTYMHCMAGLGRAGTMAAALLILNGMNADAAVALVRWARPGAIQSDDQEAFLASLEGLSRK